MLYWFGPLAVNVPLAAVTPFANVPELAVRPPGKAWAGVKALALVV